MELINRDSLEPTAMPLVCCVENAFMKHEEGKDLAFLVEVLLDTRQIAGKHWSCE